MNKPFYILLFVFFIIASARKQSHAQTNLVYNGDFELYDTCPSNISAPPDYEIRYCLGWNAPTYGSSDYFNICNNFINSFAGVPSNQLGFQQAYSGNAYCGFIAHDIFEGGAGCNYSGQCWWEYIQGKFNYPLVAGHTYKLSWYVSLATELAVGQLGAYISNLPISSCNTAPLNYTPQIVSPAGIFLDDTLGWTIISGDYVANGGEQYITIGNFKDSISTDTIGLVPGAALSYYYVDGIETYDLNDIGNANFFTPNNDGMNDVFYISGLETGDTYQIYNRWGIKIAEGNYKIGWDGTTTAGLNCTDGVYYYVTETKSNIKKKGFVQLIR